VAAPMWRLSGWHWAKTVLAWTAFAGLLYSLAEGDGRTRGRALRAEAAQATRPHLPEIQTGSLPDPAVRQTMHRLDVNSLAAEAFGDNDVRPIIR
jgi:hypothetical protein